MEEVTVKGDSKVKDPQPSEEDLVWLARALENARKAGAAGGSSFGAVVADGSMLLGEGGNETVTTRSPIRHVDRPVRGPSGSTGR